MALRPELSHEYKALCSSEISVTDYLFEDDLDKQIKEITDAKRVSRKITDKHTPSQRHSPLQSNTRNRFLENRQSNYKSLSYGRYPTSR